MRGGKFFCLFSFIITLFFCLKAKETCLIEAIDKNDNIALTSPLKAKRLKDQDKEFYDN